jgi:hypothetical protein
LNTTDLKASFTKSAVDIVAGESKGPFKEYIMPEGHSLWMTDQTFKDLGKDVVIEMGKITIGKDSIVATNSEAQNEITCIMDAMRLSNVPVAGAISAESIRPWPAPLDKIAENFIMIPENKGKSLLEELIKPACIPLEIFNINPDYDRGIFVFSALHESGHIKDGVDRSFFETFFETKLTNDETLAGELFADNTASEPMKRLGYAYEADLFLSFRIIRDFAAPKEYFENIDSDHATPVLVGGALRPDADAYLEEAKQNYGEINKIIELVDSVNSKIFTIRDISTINSEEAQLYVGDLLTTRYATTKALLEQDKITDTEQKTYAEYFVGAMERHLEPTLLHEIESDLVPKAMVTLSQMEPLELQAITGLALITPPPNPQDNMFASNMVSK